MCPVKCGATCSLEGAKWVMGFRPSSVLDRVFFLAAVCRRAWCVSFILLFSRSRFSVFIRPSSLKISSANCLHRFVLLKATQIWCNVKRTDAGYDSFKVVGKIEGALLQNQLVITF